jgi:hypothetical protein
MFRIDPYFKTNLSIFLCLNLERNFNTLLLICIITRIKYLTINAIQVKIISNLLLKVMLNIKLKVMLINQTTEIYYGYFRACKHLSI